MGMIKVNVTAMFSWFDPSDVSGSQAELGRDAGQITWGNALTIASEGPSWLLSSVEGACAGMREWALEAGAWTRKEVREWSTDECLALLVQNIASDLRMLGSDENELETLAGIYADTDWERESEYPTGSYYTENDHLTCDYHTGV